MAEQSLDLIDANSPEDELRWCQKFRCTEQELRDAITRVGNDAAAVERELATNPRVTTLPPDNSRLRPHDDPALRQHDTGNRSGNDAGRGLPVESMPGQDEAQKS